MIVAKRRRKEDDEKEDKGGHMYKKREGNAVERKTMGDIRTSERKGEGGFGG